MQIILSFSKTAHWHILHVTLHLCRYNCIVVDKRVHIIATRGWDVAGCAVSATTAALQRSLSVIVWASAAHQQAAAVGSRLLGSGNYLVYSQKHIVYNIMSAVAHFLFLRCQFIRIEWSWLALTLLMLHRCRHWLSVGNSLIVHSAYTETSFCPYVCVNVRGPAFFCWVYDDLCCSDTLKWSVAALRCVQAAGDVGGRHTLSALCPVYVVCLAVSWLPCVWPITSPHHSLACNLTQWKHPTFAATFMYCRWLVALHNVTACLEHLEMSRNFDSCRGNARRLNKTSSKCQWRNIVRENCVFLSSHLGLHQCSIATCLFYYTVKYDVGDK